MPLLDLKTNLKSLKYGNDQPGGGSSGQPYQQVDINTVDSGFNRLRMTKFDDGLVRGGAIGALNAAVVDTLRIGKFLKDLPKGPLFIVKQVGLQLSNPQLEAKKLKTDNPTSGGGLLRNIGNVVVNAVNKLVNAVGPTRIYNLGINTLAQVPVGAFGIHLNRHGILPVQSDDTKYLKVAEHNNEGNGQNNRLVGYKNKFKLGDFQPSSNSKAAVVNTGGLSRITQLPSFATLNSNVPDQQLNKYISGPDSIYGIGNTIIQRYSVTEDGDRITKLKEQSKNVAGKSKLTLRPIEINNNLALYPISSNYTSSIFRSPNSFPENEKLISETNLRRTLDNYIGSNSDKTKSQAKLQLVNKTADLGLSNLSINTPNDVTQANSNNDISGSIKDPRNVIEYKGTGNTAKYQELRKIIEDRIAKQRLYITINNSAQSPSITKSDRLTSITPTDVYFPTGERINTINASSTSTQKTPLADRPTNQRLASSSSYANYNSSNDNSKSVITVNISRADPGFKYVNENLQNQFKRTNDINVDEDQLALIFTPLDPFTGKSLNTLKFLGYLTDYTENYNSTWDPVKYAGRAESFYIFKEFKRDVNVGFNIPCFNTKELDEKHCALSELASTLAGKYNNNLLGGIITKLKVGNYINNQPGIITSLTFNPVDGSPWDLDKGLAFYLKVSIGFTLIHNFLPQYYKCGFIDKKPDPVEPTKTTRTTVPPVTPTPTASTATTAATNQQSFAPPPAVARQRAAADKTYVAPPYQTDLIKKQPRDYGGGSFGGGGAGGNFVVNPTRPGGPGPGG